MLTATPAAPTPATPMRPAEPVVNAGCPQAQQGRVQSSTVERFGPPTNFGVKIPKERDLDWPGFVRFTADFKSWGLRFLQRLGAAQLMSGGDWPEEFKILALNGKLDGTALVYFERMLPLWTMES
ncbi:hypothetical protein PHMEG_00025840 [Phytophthora megakarya]|uniref:Uncharacterized protein n=1 Tax=Phytophthora megakarya TaxID=4795 RepID=A0A225VB13_9STRA|nr:hypothetical protein PHMEG_00025840 [Phytophthora megakarya]